MAKPDWEAIETAYRAGLLSIREIASQNGLSEAAIRKRAKRDQWARDLAAKVKGRADDLVRKAEVRKKVRAENALSERLLIDATAEAIANVRMEHRGDIRRAKTIANALLDELGSDTEAALPERVKALKSLSDALKNLISLERQAYDIDTRDSSITSTVSDDELNNKINRLLTNG